MKKPIMELKAVQSCFKHNLIAAYHAQLRGLQDLTLESLGMILHNVVLWSIQLILHQLLRETPPVLVAEPDKAAPPCTQLS